jgi:hypothetical protein
MASNCRESCRQETQIDNATWGATWFATHRSFLSCRTDPSAAAHLGPNRSFLTIGKGFASAGNRGSQRHSAVASEYGPAATYQEPKCEYGVGFPFGPANWIEPSAARFDPTRFNPTCFHGAELRSADYSSANFGTAASRPEERITAKHASADYGSGAYVSAATDSATRDSSGWRSAGRCFSPSRSSPR